MNDSNLFSIDVDAHLRKAASHTFGTSEHYPVELVRAALKREAELVELQLTRNRLVIQDNGIGFDSADIALLKYLMDPERSDSEKEEAIEKIQMKEGSGLLAIFAANPTEILLESVSKKETIRLHYKEKNFEMSEIVNVLPMGTRITLFSNQRDEEKEKKLLIAFCQSVSRVVKLNGNSISRQPMLSGQLATIPLSSSSNESVGQVGIPQTGRNCHFRLLDQGIPWHHFTLPPQDGFIFDAAIETTNDITADFIKNLCQNARRLYQWLRDRFPVADSGHQERIEDLLFTYCRLSGDDSLILEFAPFKIFNSKNFLSLRQVKKKSNSGELYGVAQHRNNLRYNTGGKTVLSLTQDQADLLINHLKIPVNFLSPIIYKPRFFSSIRLLGQRILRKIIVHIIAFSQNSIPENQLNKQEQMFIFALSRYLSNPNTDFLRFFIGAKPVFTRGTGLYPAFLLNKKQKMIIVRRNHPLVRKSIAAVQTDARNIELFIPLIVSNTT